VTLKKVFFVSVLLALVAGPAGAVVCQDNPGSMQAAQSAVKKWESRNSTELPDATRLDILGEFCEAAENAKKDNLALDDNRIKQVSGAVMTEYLDGAARPEQETRTMEASLRQSLGFGGIARPVPGRYALLEMTYARTVDYIEINGDRMSASVRFLVPRVQITLRGFAKKLEVCTSQLNATGGGKFSVTC
jgi:hypothetical protein